MLTKRRHSIYARDEIDNSKSSRLGKFLKSRLSPEDFEELQKFLQASPEEKEEPGSEDSEREQRSMIPAPGGKMVPAQDAKPRDTWESRFPMAARIRIL